MMAPTVVVSAAYGTLGDVAPLLGLTEKLLARGVPTTLVIDAYFLARAQPLREAGARVLTLGSAAEYEQLLGDAKKRWSKPQSTVHFWLARLEEHYRLLESLAAEAPGRVAFVGHALDLPVRLIEEKLRLPCATVLLQPWMLRSKEQPCQFAGMRVRAWYPKGLKAFCYKVQDFLIDYAYTPQLNAFRAQLHLPPVIRVYHKWFLAEGMVLGLWPDWFAKASDFPQRVRICDFPFTDGAAGGFVSEGAEALKQLAPELRRFLVEADGTPVYAFTLGSAPPPYAPAFFAAAVAACERLGARCVLLTASAALLPQPLPASAHHAAYAPFSSLMQHVAAFVYNGGFGGLSQALRAGVPQLVVPGRFDQPHNASEVEKLGVGLRLDMQALTARSMAAALRKLREAAVRARCAEVAARCAQGSDGLDYAALNVVEFATRRCAAAEAPAEEATTA